MMMMPAGPPAMRLLALADVNNAGEAVKMAIARFLTVSTLLILKRKLFRNILTCLIDFIRIYPPDCVHRGRSSEGFRVGQERATKVVIKTAKITSRVEEAISRRNKQNQTFSTSHCFYLCVK